MFAGGIVSLAHAYTIHLGVTTLEYSVEGQNIEVTHYFALEKSLFVFSCNVPEPSISCRYSTSEHPEFIHPRGGVLEVWIDCDAGGTS